MCLHPCRIFESMCGEDQSYTDGDYDLPGENEQYIHSSCLILSIYILVLLSATDFICVCVRST